MKRDEHGRAILRSYGGGERATSPRFDALRVGNISARTGLRYLGEGRYEAVNCDISQINEVRMRENEMCPLLLLTIEREKMKS